MDHVDCTVVDGIARVVLARGKVNALNEALLAELNETLDELRDNTSVSAVLLTGRGNFFSFGFDVPQLYSHSEDEFTLFLQAFTRTYTSLFVYPKPVLAVINGHAVAGGCMLALACDRRIMVRGRHRIALNELAFGSSVFAGCVEMLNLCVGPRRAQSVLYDAAMYAPEEALELGLVDRIVDPDALEDAAAEEARTLAGHHDGAFRSVKLLLRGPVAETMRAREPRSIADFVEIWYSAATRESLREIRIRD
ncbi:MAG: enoyl-CoA hydratase/isomerase family protein [bacterium]|nr:enoyl-CoA hydratase/isomerase family protein [bacterium]